MVISRKIIIPAVLFLLPMLGMAEEVTEEWVARFNGLSIDSYDKPRAMAVDSNGNVYVTGSSATNGNISDLVTIKYDFNGVELWRDRYNGNENLWDEPTDLKIDFEGNVYVAGYSTTQREPYQRDSALLIKYDSNNGDRKWVERTNYSGSPIEQIQSIVLDSLGNIYTAAYAVPSDGSGESDRSYFISKYNSEGEFIRVYITNFRVTAGHVSIHDSPLNLAVDSLDNIYMIGNAVTTETGADFLTIKFNSLLDVQWIRTYNNEDDGEDHATSIAIDEDDNIYVSGGSSPTFFLAHYLTIKYNSSGDQQWVIDEPDSVGTTNDLFVKDTYFYVTGDHHDTIKYTTGGSRIWKKRLIRPASEEEGTTSIKGLRIAVNDLGEIFTLSRTHLVTTKYDENGNEQWSKHFEGESDQLEFSSAIATYGDSVYVTGLSAPSGNRGYDYVTIKYSMTFDEDGDGVDNTLDNCPSIANPSQLNTDGDAQGNACDPDDDNDGVNDIPDNCPLIANSDQLNTDGDAQGNACDSDDDNDGVNDIPDNCPLIANSDQLNTDGDAQGNACDPDDDNDEVDDSLDSCPLEDSTGLDADNDGCIDTVSGLVDTLDTLVSEGAISEQMSTSLSQKINHAIASADRDNLCTAINQLESFKNQIEAQRGKKVSDAAADLLISYSNNLISRFEADLGVGESCS